MQTEDERIAWLHAASYRDLLAKWRFEPSGSEWFQGDTGWHFVQALNHRRKEIGCEEAATISKEVGW